MDMRSEYRAVERRPIVQSLLIKLSNNWSERYWENKAELNIFQPQEGSSNIDCIPRATVIPMTIGGGGGKKLP